MPEKELALALKALVSNAFMGMIDVFVSSDPESISMGGKWLDEITYGLKSCAIEIVLASPASVQRPWINFEAGAGWVRDIPVIPLCHSGMSPSNLPAPLSSLQGALATDTEQLQRVLDVMAKTLECNKSTIELSEFVQTVKDYQSTSKQLLAVNDTALTPQVGGLNDYEVTTLIATAEESEMPGAPVWPHEVKERLNAAGFRDIAASLGIAGLQRKGLVETKLEEGDFQQECAAILATSNGWRWLHENVDAIELRNAPPTDAAGPPDDEIPF